MKKPVKNSTPVKRSTPAKKDLAQSKTATDKPVDILNQMTRSTPSKANIEVSAIATLTHQATTVENSNKAKRTLNVLFIHQNFPGQYRALAPECVKRGHNVMALSNRPEKTIMGIHNIYYQADKSNTPKISPWLLATESAVIRGKAAANALLTLIHQGFKPDVIVGHAGWGELLYLRQVLPTVKIISFCEYYYLGKGGDLGFDPEFASADQPELRSHTRNLHLTSSLVDSDVGISPTHFQANLFPDFLKQRIKVIHDGIETDRLLPRTDTSIRLDRDNVTLTAKDEVVTFINRNLEPMRGYHSFIRAVPQILKERPNARIVLVGGHDVSYGAKPGKHSYKDIYLHEIKEKVDLSRLHFVGQVPYRTLVDLLCLSSAHVYLTYPFVLSWSMLEAMSLGCIIIGSKTPPVEEIIKHGENGYLVDFFDAKAIANQVCEVLEKQDSLGFIRENARAHIVKNYDFKTVCLPQHIALIENI